jgi:hypothetical protein
MIIMEAGAGMGGAAGTVGTEVVGGAVVGGAVAGRAVVGRAVVGGAVVGRAIVAGAATVDVDATVTGALVAEEVFALIAPEQAVPANTKTMVAASTLLESVDVTFPIPRVEPSKTVQHATCR